MLQRDQRACFHSLIAPSITMRKVKLIIMETLADRYIGICQEMNQRFPNYRDNCTEEAVKEITKKEIKKVYKKQSKLSKKVKIHKPKLSFSE